MTEGLFYDFEITLHRLQLELNFPCTLQIWIKRKKNKALSKKLVIKQPIKEIDINDPIKINAKCRLR